MPQATQLSLQDGKATPVTHVFTPSKVSDLVATFYGPGSTLAGRETIVITRREASATVAGKVNFKVQLPVEVTALDGTISVDYQDLVSMDFVLSPKSTSGVRKDARVIASNLLKDPLAVALIDAMDGIF